LSGVFAAIIFNLMESTMEIEHAALLLAVMVGLGAVLLFTPYEAFLEGVIAVVMVTAVLAGFLMHPRREVFYVRTALPVIDPDRNKFLEHDLLAVRVELVRLWLLFVPTVLAVASLVFFAAGGPMQFSFLNWFFHHTICPSRFSFCNTRRCWFFS
jgi:uncharacterized membrane-anchored protein